MFGGFEFVDGEEVYVGAPQYEVGDVIEYVAFAGERRQVRVTFKSSDIKNGRPGFDGELAGGGPGSEVWGYDSQIVRVVATGYLADHLAAGERTNCHVHEAGACYDGCPDAY